MNTEETEECESETGSVNEVFYCQVVEHKVDMKYLESISPSCSEVGVFAVETGHQSGRVIEGVMDSGAAESVAPKSVASGPAATDPRTSKQTYRTACVK